MRRGSDVLGYRASGALSGYCAEACVSVEPQQTEHPEHGEHAHSLLGVTAFGVPHLRAISVMKNGLY